MYLTFLNPKCLSLYNPKMSRQGRNPFACTPWCTRVCNTSKQYPSEECVKQNSIFIAWHKSGHGSRKKAGNEEALISFRFLFIVVVCSFDSSNFKIRLSSRWLFVSKAIVLRQSFCIINNLYNLITTKTYCLLQLLLVVACRLSIGPYTINIYCL